MSDLDRLAEINDLETAKTFLLAYAKENERLNKRLSEVLAELAEAKGTTRREQLELELVEVKEQLDKLRHQTFGDSSERRPKPSADDKPKPSAKKTGHGPRPQPKLPIKTRLLNSRRKTESARDATVGSRRSRGRQRTPNSSTWSGSTSCS